MISRPPQRSVAPALLSGGSDADLARRVRDGDDRAFEMLLGRHRDALSRYCRAVLRHDQDAEDAFQAATLRAYRGLGRGDAHTAVRPWLFRIAHNECLRLAQARIAWQALTGAEVASEAQPPPQAQMREELRQLRSDLFALPLHQRSALVLRELSGLSHREIADTLDAAPEAVKQFIHEARASLDEFGAGRSLDCEDVRRRISDGDGRALRARALGAHLRGCAGCRAFHAGIGRRRGRLAALFPPIPPVVAERVLAAITGGGTAAGTGGAGMLAVGPGVGAKLAGVAAAAAALLASGASLVPAVPGAGGAPDPARSTAAARHSAAPLVAEAARAGGRAVRTAPRVDRRVRVPASAQLPGSASADMAPAPASVGVSAPAVSPPAAPPDPSPAAPASTPGRVARTSSAAAATTSAPALAPPPALDAGVAVAPPGVPPPVGVPVAASVAPTRVPASAVLPVPVPMSVPVPVPVPVPLPVPARVPVPVLPPVGVPVSLSAGEPGVVSVEVALTPRIPAPPVVVTLPAAPARPVP